MQNYGRTVSNDAELLRCVLFRTPVMIVNNHHSLITEAIIISYDDQTIFVEGSYFFRSEIQIHRIEIKTSADFFNSIIFQSPVEIHSENSIAYEIINDFNDEFIFVDNAFYFRSQSRFFVV
ncbi:hypothetical protein [Paenibacillus agricola]|uniref:Uncharacterized protein n=1 Tax=Paenibacillus agricola TaxID=2716264 RepID=A0ABX0JBL8_9BACL|nr:hypothetical protein [Paenibacillus agricola]NHN33171.1 hypothetical protein [Paenibacillus agricola]